MFYQSKCDLCGDCLVRCQYIDYDEEKAVQEIAALIEGKDTEIISDCITCVACNEYCDKGANPFDLIAQVQEKTIQEKARALPVPESMFPEVDSYPSTPSEVIRKDPDRPPLSLCVVERFIPQGAIDGQMFDGLTVIKGGDYFCYLGYIHAGKESAVRQNAQKFVDNLASVLKILGSEEIVLIHDECYSMLKYARDYGIEAPFKPIHIFEYLLNYLKDHHSSITRLRKRIAYQRPCSSRYTPEKDAMLDEILELIGAERPARKYEGENALCCATVLMPTNRERAAKIRDMNVMDAKEHGAEAMVFLCPGCSGALARRCRVQGLAPIFITDLCRMALGEKPFPA